MVPMNGVNVHIHAQRLLFPSNNYIVTPLGMLTEFIAKNDTNSVSYEIQSVSVSRDF